MIPYFETLGRTVLERWRPQNFSLEAFPEIARSALEESPPSEQVDLEEMVREFLLNDEQPYQSQSGFGQPELVAFDHSRFYIQVLFWLDGTTDIHQHEFSGAFHVMQGSSLHAEFDFAETRSITPHLRLGDLEMRQIELLETGRTVPITSGRECIHSLFHLDTPSVTVVIRTINDPGTGPQFNYLPPHLAIDPLHLDALVQRRKQLLGVLEALDHPSYATQVADMLETLDFERGFSILQHAMSRLEELGEWDAALETFRARHGDLAKGVPATLAECRRRETITAMRYHIEDPDHRFFLALLMNVPTRETLLGFIAERFPDRAPIETLLGWAEELIEPTDVGLGLLDADFPDTGTGTPEERFERIIAAVKAGLESSSDDRFVATELTTLRDSCLSPLFL